jgi:ABC-type sugar transport system ATPase subunit
LIKILAGIHAEYDGTISLAGRPVRFATPHEANRQGISVIHQEMLLVDSTGAADNILFPVNRPLSCKFLFNHEKNNHSPARVHQDFGRRSRRSHGSRSGRPPVRDGRRQGCRR